MKTFIAFLISTIITFFIIREIIRLIIGDSTIGIFPGWHTTILPTQWILTLGTLIIFLMVGLTIGILKVYNTFLNKILNSHQNQSE